MASATNLSAGGRVLPRASAAVRAVADEGLEDALARSIAAHAGRRPDCERLLWVLSAPEVVGSALASAALR